MVSMLDDLLKIDPLERDTAKESLLNDIFDSVRISDEKLVFGDIIPVKMDEVNKHGSDSFDFSTKKL